MGVFTTVCYITVFRMILHRKWMFFCFVLRSSINELACNGWITSFYARHRRCSLMEYWSIVLSLMLFIAHEWIASSMMFHCRLLNCIIIDNIWWQMNGSLHYWQYFIMNWWSSSSLASSLATFHCRLRDYIFVLITSY